MLLRCRPTQRRHVRELRAGLEVQFQLREVLQAAQRRERRHVRELLAAREVQRQLRGVNNLGIQDRVRFVARATLSYLESDRTPVSILNFIRRR